MRSPSSCPRTRRTTASPSTRRIKHSRAFTRIREATPIRTPASGFRPMSSPGRRATARISGSPATRDGAISPQPQMQFSDQVVDWSGAFTPLQYAQTATFQIGGDRASHILSVHEQDGSVNYLYPVESGDCLWTWDNNWPARELLLQFVPGVAGIQIPAACNRCPGRSSMKPRAKTWGRFPLVLDGWQPWHPNPPAGFLSLNINQSRHTHALLWCRTMGRPGASARLPDTKATTPT